MYVTRANSITVEFRHQLLKIRQLRYDVRVCSNHQHFIIVANEYATFMRFAKKGKSKV